MTATSDVRRPRPLRACVSCSTCAATSTRRAVARSRTIRIRSSTGCGRPVRCTRASSGRSSATTARRSSRACPYPDRRHFSCFDFATCDAVFRDGETFVAGDPIGDDMIDASILFMDGAGTAATARWCSRRSCRSAPRGGIEQWIERTVDALVDRRFEGTGRADLNVEFFSAIPLLTITGSFGISIAEALDHPRRGHLRRCRDRRVPAHRPTARRGAPRPSRRDDLISVLVEAEITDEDGVTKRLTDEEIISLRLPAARRRIGHDLEADGHHHARAPAATGAGSRRSGTIRTMLRPVVEESVRWTPTDPMFSRFVARDTEFGGIADPRRARSCTCASAPPTAIRRGGSDPDEFDPGRPVQLAPRLRGRCAHLPRHARRPGRDPRRGRRAGRATPEPAARIPSRARPADHRDVRAGSRRGARPLRLTSPRRSPPLTPSYRRDGRSPLSPDTSPSLASAHSVPPARRAAALA